MAIKILIVDDHPVFSQGLKSLLDNENDFDECMLADNVQLALQLIKRDNPDLVITDLNIPHKNGFDLLKEVRNSFPKTKILVLSMYVEKRFVLEAKQLMANGYLSKNADYTEVLSTIKEIVLGRSHWKITEVNEKDIDIKNRDIFEIKNISTREREILYWLTQDLTASQIAEKLKLSTYTVETHKRNLQRKTGAKTSAGLVSFAIANGINQII